MCGNLGGLSDGLIATDLGARGLAQTRRLIWGGIGSEEDQQRAIAVLGLARRALLGPPPSPRVCPLVLCGVWLG